MTNQMGERLSVIVADRLVGEVTIEVDGQTTTIIDGGNILPKGDYLMKPREIRKMAQKKFVRYHQNKY